MLVFFFLVLMLRCTYLLIIMLLSKCTQPTRRNDKPRSGRQVPGSADRRCVTVTHFMINILALTPTNQNDKLDRKCPSTPNGRSEQVRVPHLQKCLKESFWKTWTNMKPSNSQAFFFFSRCESNQVLELDCSALPDPSVYQYHHWYRLQSQSVGACFPPFHRRLRRRAPQSKQALLSWHLAHKNMLWVTFAHKCRLPTVFARQGSAVPLYSRFNSATNMAE